MLQRLMKVGSIVESMGVYIPAMILQKTLGFARVLLFVYLMSQAKAQYGLWGIGMMIFTLGAPLVTLGSNHGIIRYVSHYDARGQLREFYRRMMRAVPLCVLPIIVVAVALSGPLTDWLIVSNSPAEQITHFQRLTVCWLALLNALLMAFFFNIIGFLVGLRAYRLVSLLEFAFSVLFTAAGMTALAIAPTAASVLTAHAVTVLVVAGGGLYLLNVAVANHVSAGAGEGSQEALILEPAGSTDEIVGTMSIDVARPAADESMFRQTLWYGMAALAANLFWLAAQYVGFYFTHDRYGEAVAGEFSLFLQLSQVVMFIANAAWAVILAHVVRRWERGNRSSALLTLETAYIVIAMSMMLLTLLVQALSPLWLRVLPMNYRGGLDLLPGLLMFFQAATNLALLTILANLHERPLVSAAAALMSGAAIAMLSLWLLPVHGPAGAAWASGIGMTAGGCLVAMVYFRVTCTSFRLGTYGVLFSPLLILAVPWINSWLIVAVWAALCAMAAMTDWILTAPQKQMLLVSGVRAWHRLRGRL